MILSHLPYVTDSFLHDNIEIPCSRNNIFTFILQSVFTPKQTNWQVHFQDSIPPPLKDELVIDRLSAVQVRPSHDALKKEATDLEVQIRQIQEALDTLLRIQQRSVEANLFNKANEIQEDISMKRFDLRVAQIHLRAINSQVSIL